MIEKKRIYFHLIFWGSTLVLLFLDQWTKQLALLHLKGKQAFSIIDNVFCLQYLENRGAAFGIMQGKKIYFVILTLIFFAVIFWLYHKLPANKHYYPIYVIMSLFLAGAAGNFIDRITYEYVIDFFYFELINFPIFNVADIYVTCGTALFFIFFLFYYKEEDLDILSSRVLPHRKTNKE